MPHDAEKLEVKEKVAQLVAVKFGGDRQRAFRYYDRDQDGKIDRTDLIALLKDADVGRWLTRGMWADGILAELDTDRDGLISGSDLLEPRRA